MNYYVERLSPPTPHPKTGMEMGRGSSHRYVFFFPYHFYIILPCLIAKKGLHEWMSTTSSHHLHQRHRKKGEGGARDATTRLEPQVCFILFTCREWEWRRLASIIKSPNRAQYAMGSSTFFISLSFFTNYYSLPPTPTPFLIGIIYIY